MYENLPAYKAAYDILIKIYQLSVHVPRDYRYTLCEKLKHEVMEIMLDVYKANATKEKYQILGDARERIVIVKLQLRILRDLKQISTKTFAIVAEQTEILSRQLSAWQKSTKKEEPQK